jgi:2-keto-4-pentenoate hydratase
VNHAEWADRLAEAERNRVPIPPLTGLSVEDAYRIQRLAIARRVAEGAPDFGHVLDTIVVSGSTPAAGYLQPRAEVEIALVGVDSAEILPECGRRRLVGGQEDQIPQIALELAR